ncbi:hypothetical protein O5621_13950 [Escherichia coli]|nr:hypothetical protein [Escherichia coli]
MYRLLWNNDISWSDDTSSAWQAMFDQTGFSVTEVRVILRDGSGMMSRLPGTLKSGLTVRLRGNKGDMVLYVTHSSPSGSNEWEEYKGVVDKYWELWQPIFQQIRLPEWRSGAFVQRTMNDVYFSAGQEGCQHSGFLLA